MSDHQVQWEAPRVNTRYLLGLFVIAACFLSGCSPVPMSYVVSDESKKSLDAAGQQKLVSALDGFFGTPDAPKISDPVKQAIHADEANLKSGATSYRRLCMHCHGLSGDGNGPTAKFLLPLPRDYRMGIFKFTSTDPQSNPTRDDLRNTLKNGIPGTSMPSFALYDKQEIENIIDYVILLSIRGQTERFVVGDTTDSGGEITPEAVAENASAVAVRWVGTDQKVVRPKVPRVSPDDKEAFQKSIEHGREMFLSEKAQCTKCHGKQGLGDGFMNDPNVDPKNTVDSWGNLARPANLTLGVFRGGGRPIDLFRRIHSGVKGTPMASQSTNYEDKDIWDLVNFMKYLPYHESALASAKSADSSHESAPK